MNIWIYNEQNAQISSQYSIQIVTAQPAEEEESSMLLYGALLLALGGVLVYGYRNFYVEDGYEDEYEDFDELEDIPEILAEEPVPEVAPVAPVMAPPVEVTQAPEAVPVSPVPEVAPSLAKTEELVKPKKKWFGLFGGGDSKTSEQVVEPAVAQPVAAEPVETAPVAAEPVVAQPVAAEPVVAQPVAAEPVVCLLYTSEPGVANQVEAEPGEMLIAAADRAGVHIPRFCYHERMSPVGMCRMCLVDVDTGRGPMLQPSCMVPVADGMSVNTESEDTKRAQEGILEFLLVNHPLDCPVCLSLIHI